MCVVFPVCVIDFCCYKIAKHNSSTQDYIHAGDYTLYHTYYLTATCGIIIKENLACEPSLSYNRKIIRFFIQVFSFFTLLRVVLEIVPQKSAPISWRYSGGFPGTPIKIGELLKTSSCSVEQAISYFTVNSLSKTINSIAWMLFSQLTW